MPIRRARTTSMGIAIDAVKQGRAAACVSGGNTGALMAMAKLSLRMIPGIDRPALAGLMPSLGAADTVVLDLGANTECDSRNLIQFAVMGAAYARIIFDLDPRGRGRATRREAADDVHRLRRGRQAGARRP